MSPNEPSPGCDTKFMSHPGDGWWGDIDYISECTVVNVAPRAVARVRHEQRSFAVLRLPPSLFFHWLAMNVESYIFAIVLQ
eukprot:scaffold5357_cov208-Amphora_coffeaeformis.AAC.21